MVNLNSIATVALPRAAATARRPEPELHPLVMVGVGIVVGYLVGRVVAR